RRGCRTAWARRSGPRPAARSAPAPAASTGPPQLRYRPAVAAAWQDRASDRRFGTARPGVGLRGGRLLRRRRGLPGARGARDPGGARHTRTRVDAREARAQPALAAGDRAGRAGLAVPAARVLPGAAHPRAADALPRP